MKLQTIALSFFILVLPVPPVFSESQAPASDYQKIIGRWVRPDGGYVLELKKVRFDGSLEAGYFNPNSINVSKAEVTTKDSLIKVFVELQDKGYPGSSYTLYYYEEKNALAGFYYQAVMEKTFEVVFVRK